MLGVYRLLRPVQQLPSATPLLLMETVKVLWLVLTSQTL